MKYLIQIEKKKSANLQKKFDEQSSLMFDKQMLFPVVVRETILVIVASSNQNYFQNICQSSNVVNIISNDIIQYKAVIAKLTRESLKHRSKNVALKEKSISVEATAAHVFRSGRDRR